MVWMIFDEGDLFVIVVVVGVWLFLVEDGVEGFDYVEVGFFVLVVDIVGFVQLFGFEDLVDGVVMVFDVELVVDLLVVVVDWYWFVGQGVVDYQWDEFFWEVVGVVVV